MVAVMDAYPFSFIQNFLFAFGEAAFDGFVQKLKVKYLECCVWFVCGNLCGNFVQLKIRYL
jgi:uncharacterized membrane protein